MLKAMRGKRNIAKRNKKNYSKFLLEWIQDRGQWSYTLQFLKNISFKRIYLLKLAELFFSDIQMLKEIINCRPVLY